MKTIYKYITLLSMLLVPLLSKAQGCTITLYDHTNNYSIFGCSTVAGGCGSYTHVWEMNEGNGWQTIPNQTSRYLYPAAPLQPTKYRQIITSCNGQLVVYSNEVEIIPPDLLCIESVTAEKTEEPDPVNGNYGYRFNLNLEENTGCGTNIEANIKYFHITSALYGQPIQVYTSYDDPNSVYASFPTNTSCQWVYDQITFVDQRTGYTQTFTFSLDPNMEGTVRAHITGDQRIVPGQVADNIRIIAHPSGTVCGTPQSVWQKSEDDGASWQNLNHSSSNGFSPGAISVTTRYRLQAYYGSIEHPSNEVTIRVKESGIPLALNPDSTRNYILGYTPQVGYQQIEDKPVVDLAPQIVYYDGLGRPEQDIQVHANSWFEDIITPITYDVLGRQAQGFLSYTAGNNGSYQPASVGSQESWYLNHHPDEGSRAYTYTRFEASPLNRVVEEHLPGTGMYAQENGATVKYDYGTNTQTDAVGLWALQGRSKTSYNPGMLYKEKVESPDGRITIRFTDMQGRVVEERQKAQNSWEQDLITSYSYDANGRLCLVVPPKAQLSNISNAEWDKLVYRYTYDYRGRCIEKKLPDADPIYYVYDKADRLVMSQDGNQRLQNEWTKYFYDELGREVVTAKIAGYTPEADYWRSYYKNVIETTPYNGGNPYGYNIPGIHSANISEYHILTATYYDYYGRVATGDAQNTASHADRYGHPIGQVTGQLARRLDSDSEDSKTAYFYNENRRIIRERSFNEYGGTDHKETTYSFAGQPTTQNRWVKLRSSDNYETPERYTYEYDHRGRLTKINHGVDNMSNRTLATYHYDELGREHKKILGNNLQTVTRSYDIRGRLTELGSAAFSQLLVYEKDVEENPSAWAYDPSVAMYGGDIRGVRWWQQGQNEQSYKYQYDYFNRLTYAAHSGSNNESLSYDANGNITYLSRNGVQSYSGSNSYSGNQLAWAKSRTNTYTYDANGNMSYDGLRGTDTQYNRLNLPKRVTAANNFINYGYLADGQKRQKAYFDPINAPSTATTHYRGTMVFNDDGTPDYVLHPEGMAVHTGNNEWQWHFNLTDYLGNTRAVLDENGGIIQQTDYYPFGTAFVLDNAAKNKYLYGGKELQDETIGGVQLSMYDFEARFMDTRIPRFTSIDPLSEKYYSFSPYAYCLNNPILYIDPDGRKIDLSWLQQIDKDHGTNYTQILLDDWSSQTGLTYSAPNGILSYEEDSNGNAIVAVDDNGVEIGSATARDFLIDVIDHPDVVSFTGGSQTQVRPIGTNVIVTNPNEINGYINGAVGVDNRTFGWGMIMMHELHHTGVGGSMSDAPYSDTYPGDVVTQMNVIRGELNAKGANYGQRKSYESKGNDGAGYFLPFDNISKAAIDRRLVPVQPMPGQSKIKYIKHW